MKDSKKLFKTLGFTGIGLCAACCLLPVGAIVFGAGTLAVVAAYLEWIALASLSLAIVGFGLYFLRKRRVPACDVDCGCKEDGVVEPNREG